jgi:hypothetical protein
MKLLKGDRNQCTSCKHYFNSIGAFEKHRTGAMNNRRCLTEDEMINKGMSVNSAGFWIGTKMPDKLVQQLGETK